MRIEELVEKMPRRGDNAGPGHRSDGGIGRLPSSTPPRATARHADRSTYKALYHGSDLLVLHGVVPPTPRPVDPHDHRMWAVIGVYHGQEDNQLYTRTDNATLEPTERFTVTPRGDSPARYLNDPLGRGSWRPVPRCGSRLRRRPVRHPPQHMAQRCRTAQRRVGTARLLPTPPGTRGCARTSDVDRGSHRAALARCARSRLTTAADVSGDATTRPKHIHRPQPPRHPPEVSPARRVAERRSTASATRPIVPALAGSHGTR